MHDHSHEEIHFSGSEIVRDAVIGLSDGLTVPFALAAGLVNAVHNNDIIITAGFAEIVAGSIAMGLGGYLAGKTESDHYKAELVREYYEVDHFPEKEKEEVREVFASYGLSKHLQEEIANELACDKDKWVNFMMRFELGLERPVKNRAGQSAATIAIAYILGGIIPLAAYIFTETPQSGLIYSSGITVICLGIFGWFKSKFTDQPPLQGALRVIFIGGLAAASAYFIAGFLS